METKERIISKIGIKKTKHFQLQACVPVEVLRHLKADNRDMLEWEMLGTQLTEQAALVVKRSTEQKIEKEV